MINQDFEAQFEQFQIKIPGVRLPSFTVPESKKRELGITKEVTNFEFLQKLCDNGFEKLYLSKDSIDYKKYKDRLSYELETVKDLDFTDYFLLIWDITNFCDENKIARGIGRGSCCGSLILYLINVVGIDPIKHELYFERFVSKARAKKQVINGITYLDGKNMPDVDVDFSYSERIKVIEYLENKFKGKTSKILTLSTLQGKILIKECGKLAGSKTEQEMITVAEMIPKIFGVVKEPKDAYDEVPEFKKWCDENKEIYDIALKLSGLIKNTGVHPSGYLISYDLLEENCPTQLSPEKGIVSSYTMDWTGLFNVKVDLLGLRAVSVIDNVCKALGIKSTDIDIFDPFIYRNLQDLKTPHGLFQIEADTNFKFLRKIKPKNFNDVSACLALSRPGAMAYIDDYANFSETGTYKTYHPLIDDILKETGGICAFQEQVMKMFNRIGFSLEDSESIRRCIGKKLPEEIKLWKDKIYTKCKDNNIDVVVADLIWEVCDASSGFQFNKSHARAYGALCCQSVMLKFRYPQQFFVALLKMSKNEPNPIEEVSKIQRELYQFNIKLLPPHLIKSEMDFSIEGNDIRFGLSSIKGISEKTIEKLNDFKKSYANKFEIFQAAKEAKIGIGCLSSLIQAGSMEDNLTASRSRTVLESQLFNVMSDKEKPIAMQLGPKYNFDLFKVLIAMNKELKNDKGKPYIKDSRFETIKRDYAPYKAIYEQNKKCEDFANWWYEKTLLGYSYHTTLQQIFSAENRWLLNINQVLHTPVKKDVLFIGQVSEAKIGTSKKGSPYLKLKVDDETNSITTMIFNKSLDECKSLNGSLPKEGDIVIVKGTKFEDAVFANLISTQTHKIYIKLADLKDEAKI